jgi:hypothetical protein
LLAVALLMLGITAGGCPPPLDQQQRCIGPFGDGLWPDVQCWNAYGDQSPFNLEVPQNPRIHANSAAMIQRLLGDISKQNRPNNLIAPQDGTGGEPTYYSTGDDPLFTVHENRPDGACPIEGHQLRIPAGARPEAGPDHHLAIIDQRIEHSDLNWEYDMWIVHHFLASDGSQQAAAPASGGELVTGWGGRLDFEGSGVTPTVPVGQYAGNSTAAYFGGLAGRVRWEDFRGGGQFQVNHALNIVIACVDGAHPAVFPAPSVAKAQACSQLPVNPNDPQGPKLSNVDAPPLGSLIQLNMTPEEIGKLKIRSWKKAWLQAMASYGMYVGDTGADGYFAIEVEAGNQYTSIGNFADQALDYAESNQWEIGQNSDRVGRLYDNSYDQNSGREEDRELVNWDQEVWSKLRVIDPCVPARTC